MSVTIRNKEATKRKLIDAVRYILKTEGYCRLGVNRVAKVAGVNKKLIYRYFGSFQNLVEAHVIETDYWMLFSENMRSLTTPRDLEATKNLVLSILQNQFLYFREDKNMQALISWELSSDSDLMRSIHRTREAMGQQLFAMTDLYLDKSNTDFRAVAALLVGGIYYTILHSRFNGGMFSDVDVSTPKGQQSILDAIAYIVNSVFNQNEPATT